MQRNCHKKEKDYGEEKGVEQVEAAKLVDLGIKLEQYLIICLMKNIFCSKRHNIKRKCLYKLMKCF